MKIKKSSREVMWIFILGLGVGVLIAFPMAAPVFDAKIPEGAATLWGSALGAMIAIAGSFWVADRTQRGKQLNAANLIVEIVRPTALAFDELAFMYGKPVDRPDGNEADQEPDVFEAEHWGSIRSAITIFLERHDSMKKQIHRIDATLSELGGAHLREYLGLEAELTDAAESVKKLQARATEPGLYFYPGHPSWSTRLVMTAHNSHIQSHLAGLGR